jgi:hypothetical protein
MSERRIKPAPISGPVVNRCCGKNLGPVRADEGPSDDDLQRFAGVTRECPQCGTDLYDQARECWQCGHVLESARSMPWWAIAAALVAAAAFIAWQIL